MGNEQAVRESRWINRPKTGYSLIDGELVPNADAPVVQRIFELRAQGLSLRQVEELTGVKYSTVSAILKSRIYLGEVLHNGTGYPGRHKAPVSREEFAAANRVFVPSRRRGKDLLSGRVRCGLCGKRMPVAQNGEGRVLYRCHHRGAGCRRPSRTALGLVRAAVLGLRLMGGDEELQAAIRKQLAGGGRGAPGRGPRRRRRGAGESLASLADKHRKLLDLYYDDRISKEAFAQEEQRLTAAIAAIAEEDDRRQVAEQEQSELEVRFEQVPATLRDLDIDAFWAAADEAGRRVLVEELVEWVTVLPDHLEVTVAGAPPLVVLYSEVGLKESETVRVGEGT